MNNSFVFTENDFKFLQSLAKTLTGITLNDNRKEMLYSRLVHIVREKNLANFSEYCALLKKNNQQDINNFINAVTTNLTFFFRENHHFELLKKITPEFLKRDKNIKIWSAGCSTGEEPYSIVFCLENLFSKNAGAYQLKVLATDLDSDVLRIAKAGSYGKAHVEGQLDKEKISMWFSDKNKTYEVRDPLKAMITFNQLNLFDPWPMKSLFDVIFCRNVLIYFDNAIQHALLERFVNQTKPGGYVFLGHSEMVGRNNKRLIPLGKSSYQKVGD